MVVIKKQNWSILIETKIYKARLMPIVIKWSDMKQLILALAISCSYSHYKMIYRVTFNFCLRPWQCCLQEK